MTLPEGPAQRRPGPAPRLARSWAVRDGAIYATLSTNVVTLGMVEFASSSVIPGGQLLTAVLISGIWVSFLVVAYAGLIVTIPRAGGDYVWQSRVLGGPLGFVLSVTGLWFILWLWAPIYGTILSEELFQPVAVDLGQRGAALWFASSSGTFTASLLSIAAAGMVVSFGMSGYARAQIWCFIGGGLGFVAMALLLLVSGHGQFRSSLDHYGWALFHVPNAYQASLPAGRAVPGFGLRPLAASMRLVPMMMFYLLWPNTGSSLYGEVRSAHDFRKVTIGMLSGLWATVTLSVALFLVVNETFGWKFYVGVNTAWAHGRSVFGVFPYPALLAGWLVHNQAFQLGLVALMSLWFFGWVGTLFLSSTRVIFAAAVDRVLPGAAARLTKRRRVPVAALALMAVPATFISVLYAYWARFGTFTLDAVLVIAVTYMFSALVAVVLPWRAPELWKASPASQVKLLGVPVVPVAGLATMALVAFDLYEWLSNPAYGVNARGSLVFMGCLYGLAGVIYLVSYVVRRRDKVDLLAIARALPDE